MYFENNPQNRLEPIHLLFSPLVASNSLWPHGLQHPWFLSSSISPRVHSNSCPSSQWCPPTISSSVPLSLPAFNLSRHWVFSNESALYIRWPKYWSLSINPSDEYSGLIFFRIDWFGLFAVQKTLKSLLQHHSSKGSIFLHSAFFMVQLSHPYVPTGKGIA